MLEEPQTIGQALASESQHMIRYIRRIGATIVWLGRKANSGYAFSRLRLALAVILGLSVAAFYWLEHMDQTAYFFGPETMRIFGVTVSVFSFVDVAENVVFIPFVLAYLGVITLLLLPRTRSSLLHALPLIVIGLIILASLFRVVLVGAESPAWLGNTIVWGLPLAVGVTLIQELFPYWCSFML